MSSLEIQRAKQAANMRQWRRNNPERARQLVKNFSSSERGKKLISASQKKRKQKRLALVFAVKSKPCLNCGHSFHPCAMDFDHVRGEKKFEIAQAVHAPWSRVLEEIEKCDLVCSNCHRIRTWKRGHE